MFSESGSQHVWISSYTNGPFGWLKERAAPDAAVEVPPHAGRDFGVCGAGIARALELRVQGLGLRAQSFNGL